MGFILWTTKAINELTYVQSDYVLLRVKIMLFAMVITIVTSTIIAYLRFNKCAIGYEAAKWLIVFSPITFALFLAFNDMIGWLFAIVMAFIFLIIFYYLYDGVEKMDIENKKKKGIEATTVNEKTVKRNERVLIAALVIFVALMAIPYNYFIVPVNNQKYASTIFERGLKAETPEEKINLYSKAIDAKPDLANAYYNRAITYQKIEEYDKAINDYSKYIELKPGVADAYFGRGGAFYGKKEYDRAINDYNKFIELKPGVADAYFARGTAFHSKKEYAKAIEDYRKTLELMPGHEKARSYMTMLEKYLKGEKAGD